MMRSLQVVPMVAVLLALCRAALGNGDTWTHLQDPRTGAALPAKPTPVRVEREELDVELVERTRGLSYTVSFESDWEYAVRSRYWLQNPTDKPEILKVAFPIPKSILLRETPILFDGSLAPWRMLEATDFLELHRKDMRKEFRRLIRRSKALRGWLVKVEKKSALMASKPRDDGDTKSYVTLPEVALSKSFVNQLRHDLNLSRKSALHNALLDIWQAQLDRRNKRRCPIMTLYHVTTTYGRFRIPLISQWDVRDWFLSPVTGRVLPHRGPVSRLNTEGYSIDFSILLFELHIRPRGHSHLVVRYRQPAGFAASSEVESGYIVPGLQFAYIMKVRKTWASFGPVDVFFRLPPNFRLRSLPQLNHVGVSKGKRLYAGKLQPYEYNLYAVAAIPDALNPEVEVRAPSGAGHSPLKGRRLHGRETYVRMDRWLSGFEKSPPTLKWDRVNHQVIVYCGKGKHAVLSVNRSVAWSHGRQVRLPARVRFVDNRVWVSVQSLKVLTTPCLSGSVIKSIQHDPWTGRITIRMVKKS